MYPVKTYPLKRLFIILVLTGFVLPLNAQKLRIVSVQLPDSAILGTSITASLRIENQDSSSRLGNLRIWFQNQDISGIVAPVGISDSRQYFAPGQQREFLITVPVKPGIFKGGGNTVVIWPSFLDLPEVGSDTTRIEIFVLDPNSVAGITKLSKQIRILHLPMSAILEVQNDDVTQAPEQLALYGVSGELLHQANGSRLDLTGLGRGIYILQMRFSNGLITRHKIYWAAL
jgi:hypothetical protein